MREEPAPIAPVAPVAAYELVVERIRRLIHLGTYLPGDKLPPERSLAQQLGVSRTTVREAIRVLEGEGYVETRRGATGGLTVKRRAHSVEGYHQLVAGRFEEFMMLLELREAIERAAARLAAQRRTAEDLARLSEVVSQLDTDKDPPAYHALDSAFHLGIADAAQNEAMRLALEDTRTRMWMPVDAFAPHISPSGSAHHAELLAAIEARDSDRAEEAAVAHIDQIRKDLDDARAGRHP